MGSLVPKGFKNTVRSVSRQSGTLKVDSNPSEYGRVVDIIMDSSHPRYKEFGESQALYGVFYQRMNIASQSEINRVDFAYCGQSNLKQLPLKNEIVVLEERFRADASEEIGTYSEATYWTDIIPVWNSTHLNAYPDKDKLNEPVDTGNNFNELGTVKPLKLADGDVSVEGRFGNSIRLGGTKQKNNPVASEECNGKPYIIVRAGQPDSKEDTSIENINEDLASIYILSDHKVPLKQSIEKQSAIKSNKPKKASEYKGAQIIGNADRIILNARKNDIEVLAKELVGVEARTVSIDGKEYIAFDADKIYFGAGSFREAEPVLLGARTVSWLRDVVNCFSTLCMSIGTTMSSAQLPALAAAAQICNSQLSTYLAQLSTLQSKKTFVE